MNARDKMKQRNNAALNKMDINAIKIDTPLADEDIAENNPQPDQPAVKNNNEPAVQPEKKEEPEKKAKVEKKKEVEKKPVVHKQKKPGPKAKYQATDDEPKKAINILLTPEILAMAKIAKSAYDDNLTLYIQELIVNDFNTNATKYKKIYQDNIKQKMAASMAELDRFDFS